MRICGPVLSFLFFSLVFFAVFVYEDFNCHKHKFFWERKDVNPFHLAGRSLVAILLALISALLSLLVSCCAAKEDKEEFVFVWKVGSGELPFYRPARCLPYSPPTSRPTEV